jgi:hypothetical protein
LKEEKEEQVKFSKCQNWKSQSGVVFQWILWCNESDDYPYDDLAKNPKGPSKLQVAFDLTHGELLNPDLASQDWTQSLQVSEWVTQARL